MAVRESGQSHRGTMEPTRNDGEEPPPKRRRPATIHMPPKVYRPPIPSTYIEPEGLPDPAEGLECLYSPHGKSLWKSKQPPPPRSDVILFNRSLDQAEMDRNIRWNGCDDRHRLTIKSIIEQYWDVFAEKGLKNPILGFQFVVDTGAAEPVCCRLPRYGMHESAVIKKLCNGLKHNGIVEEDRGPWGAMVVLAAKPGQEDVNWNDYVWRLCVSYRKLNAITRPFRYPIRCCDDAILEIGDAKFFIKMDLDSGYWQISVHKNSKHKLAFFGADQKLTFAMMPMGALNAAPVFAAMMEVLQHQWRELAKQQGIRDTDSKVIIDDVILHGTRVDNLLDYFRCVLTVLQKHRATVKLKKCRFLTQREEFVGRDIMPQGNAPAKSKNEAFRKLARPNTYHDLRSLIGMIGFYANWIPFFELRIIPWRKIMKKAPRPGDPGGQFQPIQGWNEGHDSVLGDMKRAILSDPILQRPNSDRRFYLKTDFSSKGYGAALCQADNSEESMMAEQREDDGGPCIFDKQMSGLRLHPVLFESKAISGPASSDHSHPGEAKAGDFAIAKFRYFLWGRTFTWIADCSSLKAFFEQRDMPTHQLERLRMRMLCYQFTIVHRNASMVKEVDLLTRYNKFADNFRADDKAQPTKSVLTTIALKHGRPIGSSYIPLQFTGPRLAPRTEAASRWAPEMLIVLGTVGIGETEEALKSIGIDPVVVAATEETQELKDLSEERLGQQINSNLDEMLQKLQDAGMGGLEVDAYVATCPAAESKDITGWLSDHLGAISTIAEMTPLKAAVLFFPHEAGSAPKEMKQFHSMLRFEKWEIHQWKLRNVWLGGHTTSKCWVIILTTTSVSPHLMTPQEEEKATGAFKEELGAYLEDGETIHLGSFDVRTPRGEGQPSPSRPRGWAQIREKGKSVDCQWTTIFDPNHPAPPWEEVKKGDSTLFGPNTFGIVYPARNGEDKVKRVSLVDTLRIMGMSVKEDSPLTSQEPVVRKRLEHIVPIPSVAATLHMVYKAIRLEGETQGMVAGPTNLRTLASHDLRQAPDARVNILSMYDINRWTTIPLPSEKAWKEASAADEDLQLLKEAMDTNTRPDKNKLQEKSYFHNYMEGKLAWEDGEWFHYEEPKKARVRQLRTRVVPSTMRQVIFSACHVSPMSGHMGIHKTFWRIAVRFWWPKMLRDVVELVKACAHCILANSMAKDSSAFLHAYINDSPFDIMFLDVWTPGEVPSRLGHIKVLTMLEGMCGFAGAAPLAKEDSIAVAQATFTSFFIPFGLPRLVVVDAGNPMHRVLEVMCKHDRGKR